MSLFKVRSFWTFNLNNLAAQFKAVERGDSTAAQDYSVLADQIQVSDLADVDNNTNEFGNFIIDLGKFHSIGQHDVIVAANLDGFICIIQVPDIKHRCQSEKQCTNEETQEGEEEILTNIENTNNDVKLDDNVEKNLKDRQLLAAKNLNFPIVDLKCGFFTSAIKQSIAVLSFDKLVIYQVKCHQRDLLTSTNQQQQQQEMQDSLTRILGEDLFSHEFEEHQRLDLLKQELATNIVVLDKHTDRSFSGYGSHHHRHHHRHRHHHAKSETNDLEESNNSGDKQSSLIQQQLHLPQRDTIAVQYTNQFLLTIVDHKKIVGHYALSSLQSPDVKLNEKLNNDQEDSDLIIDREIQLEKIANTIGSMPVAFLRNIKSHSLVVSLTNNYIYCISLTKLVNIAKSYIMKSVAQNLLLNDDVKKVSDGQTMKLSSSSKIPNKNVDSMARIEVNLNEMAEWSVELICAPIQMLAIQREMPTYDHQLATNLAKTIMSSQLLIMSRYNLDLYSNLGEHLWSQRYETPLICVNDYILNPTKISEQNYTTNTTTYNQPNNEQTTNTTTTTTSDRMLSLLCTDCLSDDKCNLLILEEDRIVWSALLGSKPGQVYRANLGSTASSVLIVLDIKQAQLSANYLGTNQDLTDEDVLLEDTNSQEQDSQLEMLNSLDEPFFKDDQVFLGDKRRTSTINEGIKRKLIMDVRLEASNQWPYVIVESKINLKSNFAHGTALQNIIATLEFDDLINFQSISHSANSLSDGAIQIQLGNCWPDHREPLTIVGQFSLNYSSKYFGSDGTNIIDKIQTKQTNQQVFSSEQLMITPKTLKVKVYLSFNETLSGFLLQEESFMLPISLIARLIHIDYSSGQTQSLLDFQTNLNPYKRVQALDGSALNSSNLTPVPYYLCDIFIRTESDIIELIDEIIESDLVCRGLNTLTPSNLLNLSIEQRQERRLSTLENVNLLAQSLDCRLKFKSQSYPKSLVRQANSDDNLPTVLLSIALKIPCGLDINKGNLVKVQKQDDDNLCAIVWLHLLNLMESDSMLPKEMIKQHESEWKSYDIENISSDTILNANNESKYNYPVLVSIESDRLIPILLLQDHLIERLEKRTLNSQFSLKLKCNPLSEIAHDAIRFNYQNILKMDNFIVISRNLHDCLREISNQYEVNLKNEFKRLKEELDRDYVKFYKTTMYSLTISKQLSCAPDLVHLQFNYLSHLTKQYQVNINRTLSKLEQLKLLDYQYSKIPSADKFVLENDNNSGELINWSDFSILIN